MGYIVMVNYWNGKTGLAKDDYSEEYSGIIHNTLAAARAEERKARHDTLSDIFVNFIYVKEKGV